jgi:inner membrane protein
LYFKALFKTINMETLHQKKATNQKPLFFKMGFILLLTLLLLLPMAWVRGLIAERQGLQDSVKDDIALAWGGRQRVTGPLLAIPYEKTTNALPEPLTERHVLFVTPEDLAIHTDIDTETRYKGIFNTVVYTASGTLSGSFDLGVIPQRADVKYLLEEAVLLVGLSDPSSIVQKVDCKWQGQESKAVPGIKHHAFVSNGFHCAAALGPEPGSYSFQVNFSFRGSSELHFLPTGKNSSISAAADWPSPSFSGKNLPLERNISSTGFTARWGASEYNRPFPAFWADSEYKDVMNQGLFGLALLQPADHYQKNMRTAKYAFLVIALSFLAFFLFEILLKARIHPVQYIMIGFSLAIFYALLLSFSEHIGFDWAYLASFAAVLLLIAPYTYSILKRARPVWLISGLFTMLYGYIFVILQLEDYALLAGSLGLFAILAAVMLLSRKIDWYNIQAHSATEEEA